MSNREIKKEIESKMNTTYFLVKELKNVNSKEKEMALKKIDEAQDLIHEL